MNHELHCMKLPARLGWVLLSNVESSSSPQRHGRVVASRRIATSDSPVTIQSHAQRNPPRPEPTYTYTRGRSHNAGSGQQKGPSQTNKFLRTTTTTTYSSYCSSPYIVSLNILVNHPPLGPPFDSRGKKKRSPCWWTVCIL